MPPPTREEVEAAVQNIPPERRPAFYAEVARRLREESPASQPAPPVRESSVMENLATGAVKGAGSLALSAFQNNPVALGQRAMTAMGVGGPDPMLQRAEQGQEALKPEGVAQSIGSGVVRAAPSVGLAALTGGASLPIQAGLQAGLSGAQSQANTAEGKALDVGLGAAAVGAGAAVGWTVKKAAALGVKEYIKALAPTKEATKEIAAKIAPELIDRGVTGSLPKLVETAKANVKTTGAQLREAYMASTKRGTTIDAVKLADALEALKKPFVSVGPGGQEIVLHQGAVDAVQSLQNTLKEFGTAAAPDQLWKFRKVLDQVVQASSGFTKPLDPFTSKALSKEARTVMQKALTPAVPGVEKLNPEFELWSSLLKVAKASVGRKQGQSGILGDVMRATAAGGAGTALLGPSGVAAAAVPYVYTRPAVRTAAAVAMNRLGPVAPVSQLAAPGFMNGLSLGELLNERK
jgi:hypothetical protein